MRQFDELTDEEILDLTDEQIERYVDLACAQEGVPFLPPEPKKPEETAIEPDRSIYKVLGIEFGNKEDAQRVADLLLDCEVLATEYLPGASYKHRGASRKDATEITVDAARVFTAERWDSVRQEAQAYEAAKRQYDADMKEFKEASNRRSEASEWIYDRLQEARSKGYRRDNLRRDYERYLQLADGDERTAARFLADAHLDARDLLPELFNVEDEAAPEMAEEVA